MNAHTDNVRNFHNFNNNEDALCLDCFSPWLHTLWLFVQNNK